jgi:hypothetical protein
MRHEPEFQWEWDELENDRHEAFYGDPILEIEADYAMEKMDVKPSDPYYGFWRSVVEHDLKYN